MELRCFFVKDARLKEVLASLQCHDTYSRLCKDRQVPAVEQSEFLSLCQLVESRGLVGLKHSKDTRQTKVSSLTLNGVVADAGLIPPDKISSLLHKHH